MPAPSRAAVLVVASLLAVAPPGRADRATTGSVTGTVAVRSARGASAGGATLIYLEGPAGAAEPAAVVARLRQKDLRFDQRVLVVVKGATVEFPNEDKVFHNVFSVSRAKRFDLGLYKSGTSKSVTFGRAGQIEVYCNIHPDMISTIKVVDNRFHTFAAPDGSFRLDGVPPGTYPIVGWRPGGETRGEVVVTARGTARVELILVDRGHQTSHTRRDGSPYGRYQ